LGNKANRMISKERNKLLIGELNERFNFANSQVNQLPYERKIVQEGMVSLQFVTQNGINLLPIPPSWITEGFVEDLLIFLDNKIKRMISKERNKLLIGELNERFNFANSQVNQLPYERKIVQEGMVSLQFVTQNGINLLPIPPSWITEGFVEDLLIFIDSKINERFYIKPEDVNTLKMNFPKFFEYVNSTIIKREKIVKDFEEDLGY